MIEHDKHPALSISDGSDCAPEQCWPVTRRLLIGREKADITIAVSALSRSHAEVSVHHSMMCKIRDLNSRNGTAVNGVFLTQEPYHLSHGDTIVLAGAVELRYTDPNATPLMRKLGKLSGLWIDPDSQDVWIDAKRLTPPLSNAQMILLQTIIDADGALVSKNDIIARVWPDQAILGVTDDAVDSLVKRLRRRLATLEQGKPVLEIVRGRGLRLKTDNA